VEQQRPARGAEREVSQLVEGHEVEAGQAFGDRLCCTNQLMAEVPLSPDRVIPRLEFRVCRVR